MRVTVHQPEFMPWLGFFHKARMADVLVLLDDAQYRKNYFHNRNRIRTPDGWVWVTVPVEKNGIDTPMKDTRIASKNNPRWRDKIETAVRLSYGRAPFFDETFAGMTHAMGGADDGMLTSLNVPLVRWLLEGFGLAEVDTVLSSSMHIETTASQRILDICLQMGATTYVSGVSGMNYLDVGSFEKAGVAIEWQEFHHPIYQQLHLQFQAQISAVEALFLLGPEAHCLLRDDWPEKIDQVFA